MVHIEFKLLKIANKAIKYKKLKFESPEINFWITVLQLYDYINKIYMVKIKIKLCP